MPKKFFVKKAVILPRELWKECQGHIEVRETDFSKFCRMAIREKLARITDSQTLEVES